MVRLQVHHLLQSTRDANRQYVRFLVDVGTIVAFYLGSFLAYCGGPILLAKYVSDVLRAGPNVAMVLCFSPFLLISWGSMALAVHRMDKLGRVSAMVGMVGAAVVALQQACVLWLPTDHPSYKSLGVLVGLGGTIGYFYLALNTLRNSEPKQAA